MFQRFGQVRPIRAKPLPGTPVAEHDGVLIVAMALSLLVGVALGVLGGGGSILTVPILRYALGLEAHRAIALSLLVVGTTSLAALIPHARRGRVRWKVGALFGLASMLGAYAAGSVARFVPEVVLLLGFALMMLATAAAMLRRPSSPEVAVPARESAVWWIGVEGLVVGAITGMVGAGGGFLVVPALVLLGGLGMEVAVGTSLLVIALKSFAAFAGYVGHTPIDWSLALLISLSAVTGSLGGSLLVHRLSPSTLRQAFGWFVVAMALFIASEELLPLLGKSSSIALGAAVAALGTLTLRALAHVSRCFTGGRRAAPIDAPALGTERVSPEPGDQSP